MKIITSYQTPPAKSSTAIIIPAITCPNWQLPGILKSDFYREQFEGAKEQGGR